MHSALPTRQRWKDDVPGYWVRLQHNFSYFFFYSAYVRPNRFMLKLCGRKKKFFEREMLDLLMRILFLFLFILLVAREKIMRKWIGELILGKIFASKSIYFLFFPFIGRQSEVMERNRELERATATAGLADGQGKLVVPMYKRSQNFCCTQPPHNQRWMAIYLLCI